MSALWRLYCILLFSSASVLEKSVVRKVCISTFCSCFSLWTHTFYLVFHAIILRLKQKNKEPLAYFAKID